MQFLAFRPDQKEILWSVISTNVGVVDQFGLNIFASTAGSACLPRRSSRACPSPLLKK